MKDGARPQGRLSHRAKMTIALVVWLCVIWGHSLANADLSSAESSRFVELMRPFFGSLGLKSDDTMTLIVRKTAHFTEYAILGGLAWNTAVAWFGTGGKAWGMFCAVWVMAPVLDESIQLLVPGRSGMIGDVVLDMCGGIVGLCVGYALSTRRT